MNDFSSPRSITACRMETEDIDDGCSSVNSATSKILGTLSDIEGDFDLALPTEFPFPVKATLEKDVVVEQSNPVVGDGKSEKIVPASTEKSSTESTEASKPTTTLEIIIPVAAVAKPTKVVVKSTTIVHKRRTHCC